MASELPNFKVPMSIEEIDDATVVIANYKLDDDYKEVVWESLGVWALKSIAIGQCYHKGVQICPEDFAQLVVNLLTCNGRV